MPYTRVTVSLPAQLVADIDSLEQNRSRFVLEAVQREVTRRRREELRRSLRNPHPESQELADLGLADWQNLPPGDESLLEPGAGTTIRWSPGRGWEEE